MKRLSLLLVLLMAASVFAQGKRAKAAAPRPPGALEEPAEEPPVDYELTDEEFKKFEQQLRDALIDGGVDPDALGDFEEPSTGVVGEPDPLEEDLKSPFAKTAGEPELTDEQVAGFAIGGLCCCLLGLGGLGLIIWLLVRKKPGAQQPGQQGGWVPPGSPQPQQPGGAGGLHLSILAIGLEPGARALIDAHLAQMNVNPVPTDPIGRQALAVETARALLQVQPSWRWFGYGEKPAMSVLQDAEKSYRSASDDFRTRASTVMAADPNAPQFVVATILVCSRRHYVGVSALNDPNQVRTLLEGRLATLPNEVLGAELLWAPAEPGRGISETDLTLRYPEMQRLS